METKVFVLLAVCLCSSVCKCARPLLCLYVAVIWVEILNQTVTASLKCICIIYMMLTRDLFIHALKVFVLVSINVNSVFPAYRFGQSFLFSVRYSILSYCIFVEKYVVYSSFKRKWNGWIWNSAWALWKILDLTFKKWKWMTSKNFKQ